MRRTANALLDEITTRYAVDEDRIYLTGVSMGGAGTWRLAAAHPERFAAIAPICGWGDPRMARRLAGQKWERHEGRQAAQGDVWIARCELDG